VRHRRHVADVELAELVDVGEDLAKIVLEAGQLVVAEGEARQPRDVGDVDRYLRTLA
jgi:hypothetical protein